MDIVTPEPFSHVVIRAIVGTIKQNASLLAIIAIAIGVVVYTIKH
jgi:hypothetical protein